MFQLDLNELPGSGAHRCSHTLSSEVNPWALQALNNIALWVLAQVYLSDQVPRAQFKLTQRFPQFFKGRLE